MPEKFPSDDLSSSVSKGRILVVDDEPDIRESLEVLLTMEGYDVDLARDGGEGLHKLESSTYDLVLLDFMMPDRSGMEILSVIRERDRVTPIFLITAYGSIEVAVQALKLGANDYVPKPWDNEKLVIEIDRMVTKGRLEAENTQLKRASTIAFVFLGWSLATAVGIPIITNLAHAFGWQRAYAFIAVTEVLVPTARSIARIGERRALHGETSDAWGLEPLYLRRSAAEEKAQRGC
jgi:CheY-like chemotaxis protein